MPSAVHAVQYAPGLLRAERLTLAVLLCGVASLSLSDFVSPLYWGLSVVAALWRFWRGVALSHFTGSGWRRVPGRYVRQLSARSDLLFSTTVGIGTAVYREASDHPYVHLPDGVVSIRRMPEPGRDDG